MECPTRCSQLVIHTTPPQSCRRRGARLHVGDVARGALRRAGDPSSLDQDRSAPPSPDACVRRRLLPLVAARRIPHARLVLATVTTVGNESQPEDLSASFCANISSMMRDALGPPSGAADFSSEASALAFDTIKLTSLDRRAGGARRVDGDRARRDDHRLGRADRPRQRLGHLHRPKLHRRRRRRIAHRRSRQRHRARLHFVDRALRIAPRRRRPRVRARRRAVRVRLRERRRRRRRGDGCGHRARRRRDSSRAAPGRGVAGRFRSRATDASPRWSRWLRRSLRLAPALERLCGVLRRRRRIATPPGAAVRSDLARTTRRRFPRTPTRRRSRSVLPRSRAPRRSSAAASPSRSLPPRAAPKAAETLLDAQPRSESGGAGRRRGSRWATVRGPDSSELPTISNDPRASRPSGKH